MYAFHYRIHGRNIFLYMLDYVHDWEKLRTRDTLTKNSLQLSVMLIESVSEKGISPSCWLLLQHILSLSSQRPPVKPRPLTGVAGEYMAETRGQHPNNLWAAETQGQLYHETSCNSPTPYSDNSERKGIHSDVKLKTVNAATRGSNSETPVSCEGKPDGISTPSEVLNHSISNSVLYHSTNSELRTFRIASNTLCAPFSGKNKTFRLPRRVRRRISQLLNRLQRNFRNHQLGPRSTNGDFQCILMWMREYVQPLPRFIILVSEETWVQLGMNPFDPLKLVPDFGSYITSNSQKALSMLSVQPKVRIKQKTNFREQTVRTKCGYTAHVLLNADRN